MALKVIRPDATADPAVARDLERRFKRELVLARQVTHRNVVRIHDLGELDGIKYITMPYVQGADLATILKREGRLRVSRALQIARQIVAGLVAAHDAGIVHRDLKPANVMIDPEGHACLLDFGIARPMEGGGGFTVTGSVVGTLEYMAPEQVRAEPVDQRTDIYACGLILYDMLAGPRQASGHHTPMAELMERMQRPPMPARSINPDIPGGLDQLITRCVDSDPAKRPQTSRELAAELDRLDQDGHSSTSVGSRISVPAAVGGPLHRAWRRGSRWKTILAAVTVLVVIALGVGQLLPRREVPPPPEEVISLAVLPFRNASGDPSLSPLGSSLAEILRTEVGQSAYLRTVSSDRLHQVLGDLRIEPTGSLGPADLRRLADALSVQAVLWGQYVKFGQEIRIDATLQDFKRNQAFSLAAAAPETGLLSAVDQLASATRERLADSPDILKSLQASSGKPSTHSFEALERYTQGMELAREGNHLAALKRFEAAVQTDPDFALGYSRLAQTYAALGYDQEAQRESRRAVGLSQRLPPHEKYLIQATHARIVNDTAGAVAAYENLLKATPNDPGIGFDLAGLYEATGQLDKARAHYTAVAALDRKYPEAHLALGRVEIRSGNPHASIEHLNRALAFAVEQQSDEPRANVLQALGIAYRRLDRPEEALRHFQESLEIKRGLGQQRGMAASLSEIAKIQQRLGQVKESLSNLGEALRIRRDIGDQLGTANTLIDLGTVYEDLGRYDEALDLLREALAIQRQVGNPPGEALCLNNIGSLYFSKAQYQEAQTYFERALELREKSGVPSEMADSLHNLAETAAKLGRFDEALRFYLRALELRRSQGDERMAAITSYSMGTIFEYQGRFGAAVKARQDALDTMRRVKEQGFWLAEALSGYGRALSLSGRLAEAKGVLEEGLAAARALSNETLIGQALLFEAERLYFAGDATSAQRIVEEAAQASGKSGSAELDLRVKVLRARVRAAPQPTRADAAAFENCAGEAERVGSRHLAVECALYTGETLLKAGAHADARQALERTLTRAENLGLRALQARAHYLLATLLLQTGKETDARRQFPQALRLFEEIRGEDGAARVISRADFGEAYEISRRSAE